MFVQCLWLMSDCLSMIWWTTAGCNLWTFYLNRGLVWQDWACIAATVLWCSVIVTSAYAHRCRWLALLRLCSGVNSEIRFPPFAAFGISSGVIQACIDGCNWWALHVPSSGVTVAVLSLAYCLVFLYDGLIRQYSVSSGVICDFSFCCPVCVF